MILADGSRGDVQMDRRRGIRVKKILMILVANIVVAAPSHAYLDPGTGSIILQSLLAGIAVAIGLLRHYWFQLKSFIAGLTGSPSVQAHKDQQAVQPQSDDHQDL